MSTLKLDLAALLAGPRDECCRSILTRIGYETPNADQVRGALDDAEVAFHDDYGRSAGTELGDDIMLRRLFLRFFHQAVTEEREHAAAVWSKEFPAESDRILGRVGMLLHPEKTPERLPGSWYDPACWSMSSELPRRPEARDFAFLAVLIAMDEQDADRSAGDCWECANRIDRLRERVPAAPARNGGQDGAALGD